MVDSPRLIVGEAGELGGGGVTCGEANPSGVTWPPSAGAWAGGVLPRARRVSSSGEIPQLHTKEARKWPVAARHMAWSVESKKG